MLKYIKSGTKLKVYSKKNKEGYLGKDWGNRATIEFIELDNPQVIEIISSSDITNLKEIYYYSESESKRIITSSIDDYVGPLLIENSNKKIFENFDLYNIGRTNIGCLKERKNLTLEKHFKRTKELNLNSISIKDSIEGMNNLNDKIGIAVEE